MPELMLQDIDNLHVTSHDAIHDGKCPRAVHLVLSGLEVLQRIDKIDKAAERG